jgi:hypothetical protein
MPRLILLLACSITDFTSLDMNWAYGVTTVPQRFDELLPRTLKSLELAGFDNPRLFIDDWPKQGCPEVLQKYEKTWRDNIRTYGNWLLGMLELYIRSPHADRYAMFQDDFVTYPNLRQYIEKCPYPGKGYLNLYTFPHLERSIKGWYEAPAQKGKGAVALIFDNEALCTLLSQRYMIDRPKSATRGWKALDGGISDAFRRLNVDTYKAGEEHLHWKEYIHSPSLVQHTGIHSSMGNGQHPLAASFRGEQFNAMELLAECATTA